MLLSSSSSNEVFGALIEMIKEQARTQAEQAKISSVAENQKRFEKIVGCIPHIAKELVDKTKAFLRELNSEMRKYFTLNACSTPQSCMNRALKVEQSSKGEGSKTGKWKKSWKRSQSQFIVFLGAQSVRNCIQENAWQARENASSSSRNDIWLRTTHPKEIPVRTLP